METIEIDGKLQAVRNTSRKGDKLFLGRFSLPIEEVRNILFIGMRFTELSDPDQLYQLITAELGQTEVSNFAELWELVATTLFTTCREGATPTTDQMLNSSVSQFAKDLELFAKRGIKDELFEIEHEPIIIGDRLVQPIQVCPAINIAKQWSTTYTAVRQKIGSEYPYLVKGKV